MNKKLIFSALAVSAVAVAPFSVAAAETVTVDLAKALMDNDPLWINWVSDLEGNEVDMQIADNIHTQVKIKPEHFGRYYEASVMDVYSPYFAKFYLTGSMEKPVVQKALLFTDSSAPEVAALLEDETVKVVAHSVDGLTPRVYQGAIYSSYVKLGDTIELSNGTKFKVVKDWGYFTLSVDDSKSETKPEPKPEPAPATPQKPSNTGKQVQIELNGSLLNVDANQAPYLANGTTMVPLRIISEALGATVNYNPNKSVTLGVGNKQITINNGSKVVYVKGGAALTMAAPVTIKNGTTYVPLRFMSETFGAKVDWNQANYKVTITK